VQKGEKMPTVEDRMRMGKFVGGVAPYGYKKDPDDMRQRP
jgi:hypothetical protein